MLLPGSPVSKIPKYIETKEFHPILLDELKITKAVSLFVASGRWVLSSNFLA